MLVHIWWNIDSTLVRCFPIDCGFKRQPCKHFVCMCVRDVVPPGRYKKHDGAFLLQSALRHVINLALKFLLPAGARHDFGRRYQGSVVGSTMTATSSPWATLCTTAFNPPCLAAPVYNGPETCCASGCVSSLTCFHPHGRPWISMFTVFHNDG